MVVIPVIALAVSVALCPPGEATEAAAGSRRAAESWLEGAQGLGFGGSFTPPRPGSGFQTGRRPHVAVRVRAYTHACRGGGVERGHTLPFTCFPLPGVRAGRLEWPGMAAAGRGAAATASPPRVSFPPQTLGLPPLPCPLSPSLTLPPPPPRCLAHLLRLFVPTLSPPPFLSPLLDLRPLFSGVRGFLWLLLCGVPAAYCVEHLAEPPPGCPFWPHSALAMVPAGASFPWACVLGEGEQRGA